MNNWKNLGEVKGIQKFFVLFLQLFGRFETPPIFCKKPIRKRILAPKSHIPEFKF